MAAVGHPDRGYNSQFGYGEGPSDALAWIACYGPQMHHGFFEPPPGYGWYGVYPGAAPSSRSPAPLPTYAAATAPDADIPGRNITNFLGGTGLPSGYSYFFPREHTVIYIIKCAQPPWKDGETPRKIEPYMVPSNTTLRDLMTGFGCNNSKAEKNILHEVTQLGNNKFARNLTIRGNDEGRLRLTLKDIGWGSERDGVHEDAVWLFLTKD